jgi:hypothetical protein
MSGKPRVRLIIPIWGKFYIDRWLGFSFASWRGDGNLPDMLERCDLELVVVTKAADKVYMRADPKFIMLTREIRVHYVIMDEFFPATESIAYGVPLTLAYAKAILDWGEEAIGNYAVLMTADALIGAGTFRSLVNRIYEGYSIVTNAGIRVQDGAARIALESKVDRESGVLTIPPRDALRLAFMHAQSTVSARIVNDYSAIDTHYYHQVFWRIADDCLAARGFLLHPLCIRIERLMPKVLSPVDYGFVAEMCPNGRYTTLSDSDDCLFIELQARHSEAHLLRIAPKASFFRDPLKELSRDIAAHAAKWTTAEHRRSARNTILFHASDLPDDLPQRLAPFEAFVDGILDAMPPPVSYHSHFQWLPAVKIYRDAMARSGADARIELLEDPRNG